MNPSYSIKMWASINSMRGQATPRWQVSRPLLSGLSWDNRLIGIIDDAADRTEDLLNERFM